MATLADATLAASRVLGGVFDGVVGASPTATTFKDTDLRKPAGYYGNGTLWIKSGTHIGKTRLVNTHSPNTLVFDTLGSAPTAGDKYAVAPKRFNRSDLISAVNKALSDIGEYVAYDETLVTVANQRTYTLPTGVGGIISVDVARALADPWGYVEHRTWVETGDAKIEFSTGTAPGIAGYKIRLGYRALHPAVAIDADTIKPWVNMARLPYEVAVHALVETMSPLVEGEPAGDEPIKELINKWLAEAEARTSHIPPARPKLPKMSGW